MTAACTLAVAKTLHLPLPKTAAALSHFSEVAGRGKVLPIAVAGGNAWLIDDSYNASPTSMKAAIAKADEVWQLQGKKGRKIAALGEMLELGAGAPELHASLAQALVEHGFHQIYCSGALMQHLHNALPPAMRGAHMLAAAQILPLLQKNIAPDDVLLVKGSHGSKMYEVAAALLTPVQSKVS